MNKCVFFDADGTTIDIKTGVPEDVKNSITELVQNGHKAFLCTGRSRCLVPDELAKLPFSGMICNMGAYIEYQGKELYSKQLPFEDARFAMETLRKYGLIPVMEGSHDMYYDLNEYTTDVDWYADLITNAIGSAHHEITGNENCMKINKISAKRRPGCNAEVAARELDNLFDAIWHEGAFVGSTVEFIAKNHSKGLAIAILTSVLGIAKEDTVCFGDSNNDIEMFKAVHTRVAMGDSTPEILAMADYVTSPLHQCGITEGLTHLHLIG